MHKHLILRHVSLTVHRRNRMALNSQLFIHLLIHSHIQSVVYICSQPAYLVNPELMREELPGDGRQKISDEMMVGQILRVQIHTLHVVS